MADNIAVLSGFTDEYYVSHGAACLHVSVKPGADLSDRVEAWCHDNQEFLYISGWIADWERVE